MFSQVSVCPQDVGYLLGGVCLGMYTPHPEAGTPWTPSSSPCSEMTIEVGGMHPTGMHSY